MDGVSEVKDLVKRAKKWGMPALAVTDHGCVRRSRTRTMRSTRGDTFWVLYGLRVPRRRHEGDGRQFQEPES